MPFHIALRRCHALNTMPSQFTFSGLDASILIGLSWRPQAGGRAGLLENPLRPLGRNLHRTQLGVNLGTGVVQMSVDGGAVNGRVLAATAHAAQLRQVSWSFFECKWKCKRKCISKKISKWKCKRKCISKKISKCKCECR